MWLQAVGYSYLGLFFGVAMVIGYLIGAWVDRRLGTSPWCSLAGVFFGIAAGFVELVRAARRFQRQSRSEGTP